MALLTRYLQLNDSEDTHVFNFIVTKSVTRDSSKDVVSKDFAYGSHRWAISFSKHDKVILKYGKNVFTLLLPTLRKNLQKVQWIFWNESCDLFVHFKCKSHLFQALGVSLIWRNPSEGMNVILNLCVTLLNREYFGDNKSFVIKRALFNSEHVTNGNSSLIKVADLLTHRPRFTDANGEFQVSTFQDSIFNAS